MRRTSRLSLSRSLALLVSLLSAIGCGGASEPAPLNIILITIDTLRADHLGSYGYFRPTSPTIDALAAESIQFDRFVVPMATTLPTHLSVLTSTYPNEHGVLANAELDGSHFSPASGLVSFATAAHDAGFATAAFVSAAPLKRDSGIAVGFDTFDEPDGAQRSAAETNKSVSSWLNQHPRQPLFLWVHFFDPHHPYAPPEPYDSQFETDERLDAYLERRQFPDRYLSLGKEFETRQAINSYDGEIRYVDDQISELLATLESAGILEDGVLVLMGDHGEALGQHRQGQHGFVYSEQLNAPLLMRVPGQPARREPRIISAVDVFPTLLAMIPDLLADAFLVRGSGRDVLSGPSEDSAAAFSQVSLRPGKLPRGIHALTSEDWKFIQFPSGEEWLFDLKADPFELESVAAKHLIVADGFRRELQQRLRRQARRARDLRGEPGAPPAPGDPERIDELRALGYID